MKSSYVAAPGGFNHTGGAVDRPPSDPTRHVVDVGGRRLTTATWGDGVPEIVVLHDGLGSIGQWRSVPAELAARSGRTVLAYDRAGHGDSTPTPTGPWPHDWLHREAEVLAALIDRVGAVTPDLVGHSDGGSIAAILAADAPATSGRLVLLAAHSWVESVTVDEIARMRRQPDDVVRRLRRFHARPEALFEAWSAVWVSDEFAEWDIRPRLHAISAPTLVVQGRRDEYATEAHAVETRTAIGDNAELLLLPDAGHLLHHEASAELVDLVVRFVAVEA
jgi:pimeloyl-ACP methyl ester carboxylesterase